MRRRTSTLVHAVALSLALSGALNPAFASGLIPTERAAGAAATSTAESVASDPATTAAQRVRLQHVLVDGGVDPARAALRLAALSDAEVAQLTQTIDSAPAGGVWFMPFLVVAAVIGMLIGTREAVPAGPSKTDLFGRPRNVAVAP